MFRRQARFPPQIYYKIFTHRPVQDLGSFAPRDYTKHDCKLRTARDVNNKTNRLPPVGMITIKIVDVLKILLIFCIIHKNFSNKCNNKTSNCNIPTTTCRLILPSLYHKAILLNFINFSNFVLLVLIIFPFIL